MDDYATNKPVRRWELFVSKTRQTELYNAMKLVGTSGVVAVASYPSYIYVGTRIYS